MVEKLVATIVITYCLVITIPAIIAHSDAQSAPPMAKHGCLSYCGNVRIPFPFGIGSNCSFDERFEIVCKNSSTTTTPHPKPFLKRLPQVEVLKISIENGTLQVPNPVSFFDCPHKKAPPAPLNLSGSPFSFSDSRNRFTAVACNNYVLIDSSPNSSEILRNIGCTSVCVNSTNNINTTTTRKYYNNNNNNNIINSGCDGRNCCQIIIPSFLSTYEVNFGSDLVKNEERKMRTCRYAFVVDQSWFESRSGGFGRVGYMDYVPVMLNWDLLDDNIGNHRQNVRSIIKESSSAASRNCYRTEATALVDGIRLHCRCKDGYRGNPYLSTGCQDINECHENFNLCSEDTICVNTIGSYRCHYKTVHKVRLILLGVCSGLGALVLLFGPWGLKEVIKRKKDIKRKKKFFKKNGGLLLQQQISSGEVSVERKTKLFNSKELEKATDQYNPNRILGQGGQGAVYKGMLEDGRIIAVKKSKQASQGKAVTEFINEVFILSQINHRNVVKLLGCCLETEVPLLVYEFIPNGTLCHYIHDKNEEFQLTWKIRIRIATEVAGALSYLHFATSCPIYHRDIKSTNILLDDKYRVKIADFGTSRSISEDQTHLTTQVFGTFGYMDPEYFRSSRFTEKSDVYSFGVVIVELLSGQKPISLTASRKHRSLSTYFIECMDENRLFDIVDSRIIKEDCMESIEKVANLAYRCLNMLGKNRPTMKEITAELEEIHKSLEVSCNHDQKFLGKVTTYPRPDQEAEPWEFASTSNWSSPCSNSVVLSLDATTSVSSFNA